MVKNFIYSLIILSASPFQCSNDDDNFSATVTIEKTDMVNVKNNKTSFFLDEYITISTSIPNKQTTEKGKIFNIDNYVYNGENELSYWLYLYKKNSDGNYIAVNTKEIIVENGDVYYSSLIYGMSIINSFTSSTDSYSSKIKFKVFETGTYYIGGGFYDGYIKDQRISIYTSNEINEELIITTSIVNAKKNGLYEFKVE